MYDTNGTQNFILASENLDRILNIVFWIVLAFNLMFSGTSCMDHYVLMINSLMIIMHSPFLSTVFPGNVILFLEKTIPIVMFDIIKEEWIINPTNHFEFDEENNGLRTDDPRFMPQIKDIGYDTHNFLNNVGSVYIFFTLYILRGILLGILKLWTKVFDSGHTLYRSQYKKVIF